MIKYKDYPIGTRIIGTEYKSTIWRKLSGTEWVVDKGNSTWREGKTHIVENGDFNIFFGYPNKLSLPFNAYYNQLKYGKV